MQNLERIFLTKLREIAFKDVETFVIYKKWHFKWNTRIKIKLLLATIFRGYSNQQFINFLFLQASSNGINSRVLRFIITPLFYVYYLFLFIILIFITLYYKIILSLLCHRNYIMYVQYIICSIPNIEFHSIFQLEPHSTYSHYFFFSQKQRKLVIIDDSTRSARGGIINYKIVWKSTIDNHKIGVRSSLLCLKSYLRWIFFTRWSFMQQLNVRIFFRDRRNTLRMLWKFISALSRAISKTDSNLADVF